VSKKLERLAVDSELWKAAYYKQFVLPRAARIPGLRDTRTASEHLRYSSKLSRWLEDGHLIKNGPSTNWKQQYRLRHNWCQGQCAVSEIVVAERPPDPPLLVMMSNSTIFTADSLSGLRAWSTRAERELLAMTPLLDSEAGTPRLPTSMAIDTRIERAGYERVHDVVRASFVYQRHAFRHRLLHAVSSYNDGGTVTFSVRLQRR
jgi:hypothetical protein